MRRHTLETIDEARFIVDVIASKMGSDILLLDISDVTLIADYFIITSADSERQIDALVEAITEATREEYGVRPRSVEGTTSSGWVLLDYGGIIVHIFTPGSVVATNSKSCGATGVLWYAWPDHHIAIGNKRAT